MNFKNTGESNQSFSIVESVLSQLTSADSKNIGHQVKFDCFLNHGQANDENTLTTVWTYLFLYNLDKVSEFTNTEHFIVDADMGMASEDDLKSLAIHTFEHFWFAFEQKRKELTFLGPINNQPPASIQQTANRLYQVLLPLSRKTDD